MGSTPSKSTISLKISYTNSLEEYLFTYKSLLVFKSNFNIFKFAKFSKDIPFPTYIIPSCFTFKTLIVHPTTGNFIILNDDDEPLYFVLSNIYIPECRSELTILHIESDERIALFKDVIQEIKLVPGGSVAIAAEKSFNDKLSALD